jgi:hypothetical protein
MNRKKKYAYFILNLLLILVLTSCSHQKSKNNTGLDDLYFSDLVFKSIEKNESILKILENKNPHLLSQIQNDSRDSLLLNFWGESLNFDSGAQKKIINDQIISDLQAQFGIKNDNRVVHAGITHTYGYLFSVLETPYGFKRKRWIDSSLNYAFSLVGKSLSPETKEGGLLSNITFFVGKLAFKNKKDQDALLLLKNVSREVLNFDYSKVTKLVLEEQIKGADSQNVILRTTLIHLPIKQDREENDYLLIYSIFSSNSNKEKLVTAFPIKEEAFKKITSPMMLGASQPIVLRYNAYVNNFTDKSFLGVRKLLQK